MCCPVGGSGTTGLTELVYFMEAEWYRNVFVNQASIGLDNGLQPIRGQVAIILAHYNWVPENKFQWNLNTATTVVPRKGNWRMLSASGGHFVFALNVFYLWLFIMVVYNRLIINGLSYLDKFQLVRDRKRADSRFAPSQWETALHSNDVSHWLGASLESALRERMRYRKTDGRGWKSTKVWSVWIPKLTLLRSVCALRERVFRYQS